MTVHNYRSRQVHETLNGVHPSSSFRDMRSAKSGPNLWQIWQVFGPWASPYGEMGKWPWQCTTRGLDNSTELRMEKICQAVTEIWVPQVWQPPAQPPTRPPARTMMTIPLQPRGLRGKNYFAWDPEIRNTVDFHYISVQYSWWVTSVYAFVCKQEVRQKTPRNFILFTVAHLRYFNKIFIITFNGSLVTSHWLDYAKEI